MKTGRQREMKRIINLNNNDDAKLTTQKKVDRRIKLIDKLKNQFMTKAKTINVNKQMAELLKTKNLNTLGSSSPYHQI